MNTAELIISHQSTSTVFSITSESGISQSIRSAARWLQTEADADKCFYQTFIKQYHLFYAKASAEGLSMSKVSMRDCHVILGLDNLVRLTVHTDPDPGENRTSQLCTLPMTLKGLPRDHEITTSWHLASCSATKEENCPCKMKTKLGEDSYHLLSVLLPAEQEMKHIFYVQSVWGLCLIGHGLDDFIQCHIRPEQLDHFNSEEFEHLNQTLDSLHLDEANVLPDQNEESFMTFDQDLEDSAQDKMQNEQETTKGTHNDDNTYYKFPFFTVPPLLTRHPTPAVGRDDDKAKLREVLVGILQGLDRQSNSQKYDRILLAPDHKLSKNLIQLMKEHKIFQQFLPEFPVLHLKKSKIANIFSAYKDAGLHELLKYMKDDEQEKDWKKLVTLSNIETAARNIKRLSMAFHLAFLATFLQSLTEENKIQILQDIKRKSLGTLESKWGLLYQSFLTTHSNRNSTFALHRDMMDHCDEIVAICLAERLGGPCGYDLMLSAVKESLPFSFLNGASSYAAFCVELLHEHYAAGFYHQHMKTTLFSTPHHGSDVNIALDTQREMDHRDALKAFRPGATLSSVIPKMAIVDTMTEIHDARRSSRKETMSADGTESSFGYANQNQDSQYVYQMECTSTDIKHVLPTAELILRRNGLSNEDDNVPHNVYQSDNSILPEALLDRHSYETGKFLIEKYCHSQNLFGLHRQPDINKVDGPSELIQKLKQSKGVTIKRTSCKKSSLHMTEKQKREMKRQQHVRRRSKIVDCWSSEMNTCQAVVKPDCSKACVQKASGIRKGLLTVLQQCVPSSEDTIEAILTGKSLMWSNFKTIPMDVARTISVATVEFAGIKFKTTATSGHQYLLQIENGLIKPLQKQLPHLTRLIICEEKYRFTPDDFKAATRANRQKKVKSGISHLKLGDDIISQHKMSKPAVLQTSTGKRLISSFLARNVKQLKLTNLTLDIDSECLLEGCECCEDDQECRCRVFTKPLRAVFDNDGFRRELLLDIKQRKGEAEMSQVDWLKEVHLSDRESTISVITSGDIDSVVIHLFALSQHWPRDDEGRYKNQVFVLLQKPKPEMYNITGILELMESHFQNMSIGTTVAVSLCLGGNDFLPKFNGVSHKKWIETILNVPGCLTGILKSEDGQMHIDECLYIQLIKNIYCPPTLNADKLSLEDVRQLSIKMPRKDFRNPNLWMPPKTALQKIVKLINCHIQYLMTVWNHEADLPDFIASGCLTKHKEGAIEYNLGPDVHCNEVEKLLGKSEREMERVMRDARKQRNKRSCPETPDKQARKRPLVSTPRFTIYPSVSIRTLPLHPPQGVLLDICRCQPMWPTGSLSFVLGPRSHCNQPFLAQFDYNLSCPQTYASHKSYEKNYEILGLREFCETGPRF
ncbi:uncharacterized protein [Haliotis asinina]|uniref:uncharacterized protein n=1 Tax=Haliotis asinina TaxID=109174 RepID=UPI0035325641